MIKNLKTILLSNYDVYFNFYWINGKLFQIKCMSFSRKKSFDLISQTHGTIHRNIVTSSKERNKKSNIEKLHLSA